MQFHELEIGQSFGWREQTWEKTSRSHARRDDETKHVPANETIEPEPTHEPEDDTDDVED